MVDRNLLSYLKDSESIFVGKTNFDHTCAVSKLYYKSKIRCDLDAKSLTQVVSNSCMHLLELRMESKGK